MHRIWIGTACGLVALGLIELRHSPAVAQNANPGAGAFVWLVRHAEKDKVPKGDEKLLPQGHKRAHALAKEFANKNIKTIITSDKTRTIQTADPLAKQLKLAPIVVPYDSNNIAVVAKTAKAAQGNVLVVGHSDTVPGIIKGLGGPTLSELGVYYRLFRVDSTGACRETTYGKGPAPKVKPCR